MPESEDQLRNIAKTAFFSKVYESFVGEWLLQYIKPFLDPNQCGMKGLSTTHYLIKFLHFVHSTLDMKKPHAVLAAYIDLSKAYNRVDHSLVIQNLYDMHTPAWLLRIIYSYLQNRAMVLTYKGVSSEKKPLPGGTPQGAYLGGLIFMIKFNGAFLRPSVPRPIVEPVSKSQFMSVKFVDDGSVARTVNLSASLVQEQVKRPRPLQFRERNEQFLPDAQNPLAWELKEFERFSEENKMKVNQEKTTTMLFNTSRKWDFPVELSFEDGSQLQCVKEIKLVGVYVTEDLKWQRNTDYICSKARRKLWLLRRMKELNLSTMQLLDVYGKEVRSILEMAVPVWHGALTQKQNKAIERVQKVAFKIILNHSYKSYNNALKTLDQETLYQRRVNICKKFASKNIKSEFSLFEKHPHHPNTRSKPKIAKEFKCNTTRYSKSSLPFLSKLLNTM